MSLWNLLEEFENLAEKARAVKEDAQAVASVAAKGYEKIQMVNDIHDEMRERAREDKKLSTLGFVFQVGRHLLR